MPTRSLPGCWGSPYGSLCLCNKHCIHRSSSLALRRKIDQRKRLDSTPGQNIVTFSPKASCEVEKDGHLPQYDHSVWKLSHGDRLLFLYRIHLPVVATTLYLNTAYCYAKKKKINSTNWASPNPQQKMGPKSWKSHSKPKPLTPTLREAVCPKVPPILGWATLAMHWWDAILLWPLSKLLQEKITK